MFTRGPHKRKVYDCITVGELKDFLAYKFDVDVQYVHIDGADRVFIGNVRRTDLLVKREKVHTPEGTFKGLVLYQIYKKMYKDFYE